MTGLGRWFQHLPVTRILQHRRKQNRTSHQCSANQDQQKKHRMNFRFRQSPAQARLEQRKLAALRTLALHSWSLAPLEATTERTAAVVVGLQLGSGCLAEAEPEQVLWLRLLAELEQF